MNFKRWLMILGVFCPIAGLVAGDKASIIAGFGLCALCWTVVWLEKVIEG